MVNDTTIRIDYFTDTLCIWAYSAQVRLDELKRNFPGKVDIVYHFMPIFASVHARVEKGWAEKGGFEGFNRHQRKTAEHWEHVDLHPGVWLDTAPASSTPSHLFLKAAQLLEREGRQAWCGESGVPGYTRVEQLMWRFRQAFFQQCRDIADTRVLREIVEEAGLPVGDIERLITTGHAHAALQLDIEARDRYLVSGSPTYVFNEGRQKLYGNVGYRIIHANIEELLRHPQSGEASWC